MKKISGFIMIVVIFCVFCLGAVSATTLTKVTAYMDKNLRITFNGQLFEPKEENGDRIQPLVYNDRTYLPVRAICDLLKVDVTYDNKSSTVVLNKEMIKEGKAGDSNLSTNMSSEKKSSEDEFEYTIRGKVLLPKDEVAAKGGIRGDLFRSNSSGSAKFFIPEGKNYAEYVLDTNERTDLALIGYNLREGEGYYAHAYYSSSGTTLQDNGGTKVPVGSTNINITLIKAERSISGTITFTNGSSAGSNGKKVSVQSFDSDLKQNFHRQYVIPEGATKFDYILYVVPGSKISLYVTTYDAKPLSKYDGIIDASSENVKGINVIIDP